MTHTEFQEQLSGRISCDACRFLSYNGKHMKSCPSCGADVRCDSWIAEIDPAKFETFMEEHPGVFSFNDLKALLP